MSFKKLIFVCMGNSCSSPLAQSIMQNLMVKTSLYWEVDSAALRTWNIGRRPYKSCLKVLREHGLRTDHFSRLLTIEDFCYFDYIIAMNSYVHKELMLWAEVNRIHDTSHVTILGMYGKKPKTLINIDLSPTRKLRSFRSAYYQIKECCKQLILSQHVSIVHYDVPSTEEEDQEQQIELDNRDFMLMNMSKPWGSTHTINSLHNRNPKQYPSVPPDIAHLVNPYWGRFAPMDQTMSKILGMFTLVTLIISLVGNGLVVYIFGGTKSLRTPANLLVMNLAFSDFCMMASQAPVMLVNFYYETWVLGPLWCDIYAVCGSMFGCVSIWSMCMIALDRYNVIVRGINGSPMTIKLAVMKILFIWTIATFWTIMPLIGWSSYVPEGNLTACSIDYMTRQWNPRSYLITYSLFVYYTPLFLICYSYWFIIAAVAAHERAMREQAKKMNVKSLRSSEDCEKSAEGKLAKVALTTITLWFFAWTPYLIICYFGLFKIEGLTPLTTIWGATFAKTSAVYNPIVYGISHPKYRIVLKEKCPMCVCGSTDEPKPDEPASDTQTTSEAESKA